jgi:hypothetical protein
VMHGGHAMRRAKTVVTQTIRDQEGPLAAARAGLMAGVSRAEPVMASTSATRRVRSQRQEPALWQAYHELNRLWHQPPRPGAFARGDESWLMTQRGSELAESAWRKRTTGCDELSPLWDKRSATGGRPNSTQPKAQLSADRRVTDRPRDRL